MTKINNLAKHDTLKLVLIPYLLNFWSFWIVFYMDIDCKHWYNPLVFVVFWSISLFPPVFSLWQLFELDLKMKKSIWYTFFLQVVSLWYLLIFLVTVLMHWVWKEDLSSKLFIKLKVCVICEKLNNSSNLAI